MSAPRSRSWATRSAAARSLRGRKTRLPRSLSANSWTRSAAVPFPVWATTKPAASVASAVDFPTAATWSDAGGMPLTEERFLAPPRMTPVLSVVKRSITAATAFWLVKISQSKVLRLRRTASSGAKSSGGAIRISGSETISAPFARRASLSVADWDSERVMTTRLPASGDGEWSATLAVNLFENFACTGIDEELCDALAEFAGLIWRRGGTLADVLRAIWRADDGIHGEFTAFEARPSTERNLAAAFE